MNFIRSHLGKMQFPRWLLKKNPYFSVLLIRTYFEILLTTLITFNNSIFAISFARISSLFTIITSWFDIEKCAQWAQSTGLVTIKVESVISKIITSSTIKTSITNRATLTRSDRADRADRADIADRTDRAYPPVTSEQFEQIKKSIIFQEYFHLYSGL